MMIEGARADVVTEERPAPDLIFLSVMPGGPVRLNVCDDGVCRVWPLTDDQVLRFAAVGLAYLDGRPKSKV